MCFFTSILSGIARFGSFLPNPPLWLDLAFLVSSSAGVAVVLVILVVMLQRHAAHAIHQEIEPRHRNTPNDLQADRDSDHSQSRRERPQARIDFATRSSAIRPDSETRLQHPDETSTPIDPPGRNRT